MTPAPRTTAVLPVKELARAKTRLALPPAERARLALAFAEDTLTAVLAAESIDDVVVVTSDAAAASHLTGLAPQRIRVVADGGSGLGGAVRRGVLVAQVHRPGSSVCVVPADLPCLRAADVDTVLVAAAATRGAFVRDHARTGTTVLVLPPDQVVVQRYGADSAQRHADAGLVELPDVPRRVRHDVDTVADLLVALRMGPGAGTARACADLGLDRYGQREAG